MLVIPPVKGMPPPVLYSGTLRVVRVRVVREYDYEPDKPLDDEDDELDDELL